MNKTYNEIKGADFSLEMLFDVNHLRRNTTLERLPCAPTTVRIWGWSLILCLGWLDGLVGFPPWYHLMLAFGQRSCCS